MRLPNRSRKRLFGLLIVGVIVTVGTFGYIEYWLGRPTGSGPAGPKISQPAAFEEPWTDRAVHVVGIGDSITAGLGADRPSHTYFNRLLRNPEDEFSDLRGLCLEAVLPQLTSENLAISGSESCLHADIIEQSLVTSEDEFGLILMTSGGNDLIHNYGRSPPRECAMYGAALQQAEPWIENFRSRLGQMFDQIQRRFPAGCEIYIADIYDPTDGVGDAPSIFLPDWPDGLAIHARYNQAIRDAASEREFVHLVPLYETFLGHGSHCRQFWRAHYDAADPHYWFYSNIEDPNDRGYDAIRRVYLNTIVANTTLRTANGKPATAAPAASSVATEEQE